VRVFAIANQKGGCGKTTTAINLSACLAFLQKKVLLIDLDPQGHATCGLGVKAEFLERTSYDLFQGIFNNINDLILPINDFLSLIPTHNILSRVEQEIDQQERGSYEALSNRMAQLGDSYDYVLIDSPPHIGFLTANAITAAQEVIVPIEPSFFSLHGLAKIFETIDSNQRNQNRQLRLHALMTRFDKRTRLAREIQEEVKKYFQQQMFLNTIDENIRLKEAAASGKSIVDFDRESVGFRNYMGLAIEVIERGLICQTMSTVDPQDQETQMPPEVIKSEPQNVASFEGHTKETETIPGQPRCSLRGQGEFNLDELKPKKVLGGILFSYLNREAGSVLIAGDFSRWIVEPLLLVDESIGLWQKVIHLEPGTYHYKFLVNDVWRTDPANHSTKTNRYGGIDSVITVEASPSAYENRQETKTGTC